jgi:hypothetical protein
MVHCIYDCDEWKSRESMRLIMVSDEEHFRYNMHNIQADHEYTDEEMDKYIFVEEMEINTLY